MTGTAMVTLSRDDLAAIGSLWEKYGDAIGRKDAAAAAATAGSPVSMRTVPHP